MGTNSHIEWTTHTFNPWIGCTKVSPGCAHCYAETLMDTRYGRVKWGAGNPRVRTSAANWKLPLRWDREQEVLKNDHIINVRPRVFCASLADWLDPEVPIEWLRDLMLWTSVTPNLDWLLLTKRPHLWHERMKAVDCAWADGAVPANIWVGTTVEDQARADERIPALLKIPARVRFLSCEPLLGPIEFSNVTNRSDCVAQLGKPALGGIHWVIAGGESGAGARPMHPAWARSLRDQCAAVGVAFFMKQMGGTRKPFPEIPADLQLREHPNA